MKLLCSEVRVSISLESAGKRLLAGKTEWKPLRTMIANTRRIALFTARCSLAKSHTSCSSPLTLRGAAAPALRRTCSFVTVSRLEFGASMPAPSIEIALNPETEFSHTPLAHENLESISSATQRFSVETTAHRSSGLPWLPWQTKCSQIPVCSLSRVSFFYRQSTFGR